MVCAGADETKLTREALKWPYGEFEIPDEVYDAFGAAGKKGQALEEEWNKVPPPPLLHDSNQRCLLHSLSVNQACMAAVSATPYQLQYRNLPPYRKPHPSTKSRRASFNHFLFPNTSTQTCLFPPCMQTCPLLIPTFCNELQEASLIHSPSPTTNAHTCMHPFMHADLPLTDTHMLQ